MWLLMRPRLIVAFAAFATIAVAVMLIPFLLPKKAKHRRSIRGRLAILRRHIIKGRMDTIAFSLGMFFGAWLLVPIAAAIALVLAVLILVIILSIIPIRYRINGNINKTGEANTTTLVAKVSYLFGLVGYVVQYEEGKLRRGLRIAWHTFYGKEKPEEDSIEPDTTVNPNAKASAILKRLNVEIPVETEPPDDITPTEEPRTTLRQKFAALKAKLADIQSMKNAVLTYPNRKFIMEQAWRTAKKILKRLLPRKLNISGTVGFEDPSTTGFFFAAYGVILSTFGLGNKVHISCLFDTPDTVIKLNTYAKGSFSIARITVPVIRLILRRQVRTLIKDILNLRKG